MTGIELTDETWNPVRGCSRVSEGCRHCYAEQQAARIVRMGASSSYNRLVALTKSGEPRWTGVVELDPVTLAKPLRWRKPRRIFVNSMSDLFHESLSQEQIAAVFGVMAACPQHTFQVLTKRARRMRDWFTWLEERVEAAAEELAGRDCVTSIHDARLECILEYLDETATAAVAGHFDACHLGLTTNPARQWPLPNVQLVVSVENQDAANERIPLLLQTPAAVRGVSAEPLLGALYLTPYLAGIATRGTIATDGTLHDHPHPPLDWVIAGCESGHGARPCDVEWLRALRDQCQAAEVPFFLKQAKGWDHGRTEMVAMGIGVGPGSHRKPGGIIGAPYLDGRQHLAHPSGR